MICARRSLRRRVTSTSILVTACSVLLIAGVAIQQQTSLSRAEQQRAVEGLARALATSCELPMIVGDREEVLRLSKAMQRDGGLRFVVVRDSSGHAMATAQEAAGAVSESGRESPGEVVEGRAQIVTVDHDLETGLSALDESEAAGDRHLGEVIIGSSYRDLRWVQAVAILAAFLTAMLFTAFMVNWSSSRWTRRLTSLVHESRHIADGDLSRSIIDTGEDEIHELAIAFEEMRGALEQREVALTQFNETLQGQVKIRTRELVAARDAAEAANEAKSLFLANMSHEIRTPLNAISGFLALLHQELLEPRHAKFVSTARTSAGILLGLINDVLDFSKIEAGHFELESEEFDPRLTAEDLVSSLSAFATGKPVVLEAAVDPEVPRRVIGDAQRVRQILGNLIGNALKFTEEGEVAVRVGVPKTAAGGQAFLRFEVSDTGIGIAPEDQSRLFRNFEQIDPTSTRKHGGTGLGLAISKRLVEMMGGSIQVESTPGRGSRFWFDIPLQLPSSSLSLASRATGGHTLGHARVLAISPSSLIREVIQAHFRTWGVRVELCSDCDQLEDLVASAERSKLPFTAVVVDSTSFTSDGFDASLESTLEALQAPVILLLAVGEAEPELALSRFQVTKPVTQSELFDATVRALYGQEAVDSKDRSIVSDEDRPKLHILIAEDNVVNQLIASEILASGGHTSEVVENGQLAIDRLGETKFDLVLMDGQMPILSGFDAARKIRESEALGSEFCSRGGAIPIIALTANALVGDRQQCFEAGMDDYLTKPIEPQLLLEAVARRGVVPEGSSDSKHGEIRG